MNTDIRHTLFFGHSPEAVWEYLTTSALLAQWLMNNDFEPVAGREFQFRHNPMPAFGFDGNVYCKVLDIVPCKKLTYSWRGGPGNGVITLDSVVYWTLEPREGGTELSLVHTGFNENLAAIYGIMSDGWFKNMHKIGDKLNTAKHDNANA